MAISKGTLEFLQENRLQNKKSWFEEHKDEYQTLVVQPLCQLASDLAPAMSQLDDQLICEPKVGKSVSRIYRDTRFSHDKSLYRDVMWVAFGRDKKAFAGFPGFFFEVGPRGFRYGCGYYQAATSTMKALRERILAGDPQFQKALQAYDSQSVFTLEGEMYKKSRHPGQPEALKNWLDRKSIACIHSSQDWERLFSPDLWQSLAADYAKIAPFYHFLLHSELGQKSKKEAVIHLYTQVLKW